jgi:hypothetical protein
MNVGFRRTIFLGLALIAAALAVCHAAAQTASMDRLQSSQDSVNKLFWLANQERAARGLSPLKWDSALAAAAIRHCERMASAGGISHRFAGEGDVDARAGQAGAHFSLIEENVATAPSASGIHQGWMNSPHHRENLLSAEIDRVGVAVVARGRQLYAVADYARAVPILTQAQVEARIASTLRARGLSIATDPSLARAYCSSPAPFSSTGSPAFLMRWQNADPDRLPADLEQRLASREFREAAVGSCPPQGVGSFTAYRIAVLLRGTETAELRNR